MNALAMMDALHTELTTASTTYKRGLAYQKMVDLYNKYACVRKVWELVATARKIVDRIRKRVKDTLTRGRKGKNDKWIEYHIPYDRKTECAYGLYIKNADTLEVIASKVGTTYDLPTRMRQEINEYTEKYGVQVKIDVVRYAPYTCHADTIADESFFRSCLIWRYPELFKDNDRFNSIEIPVSELRELEKLMENVRKKVKKA